MSFTESSYGARLRNAQDLLAYVSGFTNYSPPRSQESVQELTSLINLVITSNEEVAQSIQNYRSAVDQRQVAFREGDQSLVKLPSILRGAVEAQYGKNSSYSKEVASIIRKMRGTKLTKAPTNVSSQAQLATVSVSQQSYGSLTQLFNDLVETIGQFPSYQTSNPDLSVQALQTRATELTQLNNAVASVVQQLSSRRATRVSQYAELKERIQRVKAYVKSQYGNSSSEYNLVKGLRV